MSLDALIEERVNDAVEKAVANLQPHDEWMSVQEVADYTRLSKSYFDNARSLGARNQPNYHRVGGRIVYKRSDVDAFMCQHRREVMA